MGTGKNKSQYPKIMMELCPTRIISPFSSSSES
jgi:hypothetical protein